MSSGPPEEGRSLVPDWRDAQRECGTQPTLTDGRLAVLLEEVGTVLEQA